MSRTKLAIPVLLVVLATASCLEPLPGARERTGFISLTTMRDAGNNEFIRSNAAFYKYDGLTYKRYTTDTCFFTAYSATAPTVAFLPTLDAGNFLLTDVSGQQDTMYFGTTSGMILYELRSGNTIAATPGDTLDLTIPGATGGFPATVISVKTAEPFTLNAPDTAARAEPMEVTWTPATAPGSRMRVLFRFASNTTSSGPDQQLVCDVADDGSYTISAAYADVFRTSAYEHRSWLGSRVRSTSVDLGNFVTAHLVSVYERPLPLYVVDP